MKCLVIKLQEPVVIPFEYLEYVETNRNQKIVIPHNMTGAAKWEMDLVMKESVAYAQYFIATNDVPHVFNGPSSKKSYIYINGTTNHIATAFDVRYKVYTTDNAVCATNLETGQTLYTGASFPTWEGVVLELFSSSLEPQLNSSCRFYGMKFYDGGELAIDLRPVLKNGVAMLRDEISETFLQSQLEPLIPGPIIEP